MQDGELENIERNALMMESYEECPNCALDEHRWIYQCESCGFVGCYDEVYENGCYMGEPDEQLCPNCDSGERTRIGKIGRGSVEEG